MSGNVSLTTLCLPLLVLFLPFMVAAASIGEVDAPFAQSRDDECWRKLPPVERGAGQPLPSWARKRRRRHAPHDGCSAPS